MSKKGLRPLTGYYASDITTDRHPVWPNAPSRKKPTRSSLEERRISSEIDEALSTIPAASLLIATDHLEKSILACRALESPVQDHIPKEGTLPDPENWEFWREYLGLIV